MQFKLDENMPRELRDLLAASGHDAVTVSQEHLEGGTDTQVSEAGRHEGRVLVSFDLHFGDTRQHPLQGSPGVIVLRLALQDTATLLRVFGKLLPIFQSEPIAECLWVVEETRVRIRERSQED